MFLQFQSLDPWNGPAGQRLRTFQIRIDPVKLNCLPKILDQFPSNGRQKQPLFLDANLNLGSAYGVAFLVPFQWPGRLSPWTKGGVDSLAHSDSHCPTAWGHSEEMGPT